MLNLIEDSSAVWFSWNCHLNEIIQWNKFSNDFVSIRPNIICYAWARRNWWVFFKASHFVFKCIHSISRRESKLSELICWVVHQYLLLKMIGNEIFPTKHTHRRMIQKPSVDKQFFFYFTRSVILLCIWQSRPCTI